MRVITGTARGRKLREPEGMASRPTTDNVKESMFNLIQFDIEGRRVLDLFAGTGQLGIEALSRGARSAVFVDESRAAVQLVRTNLANRIESANAYLANVHPGCRHDCIFLICDKCGHATHVDDDGLTGSLREAGRKAGFADVRPVVELRGLCNACAG